MANTISDQDIQLFADLIKAIGQSSTQNIPKSLDDSLKFLLQKFQAGTDITTIQGNAAGNQSIYQLVKPTIDYITAQQTNTTPYAYDKLVAALAAGNPFAHGSCVVGNYLYLGCRVASSSVPGRMVKINLNDLTDQTVLIFPDNTYNQCEQLTYDRKKDKIYVAHNNVGNVLNVTEVDPYDFTVNTIKRVISDSSVTQKVYYPTSCSDGTYLYIPSSTQLAGQTLKIRRYRLSDFQFVSEFDTGYVAGGHSIKYDGFGYLYITSSYRTVAIQQFILKIPTSTFDTSTYLALIGESWTDDIAIAPQLFLGMEYIFNTPAALTIGVADKALAAISYLTFPMILGSCYGVFYDDQYVWIMGATTPGRIIRLDPETLIADIYTTPAGEEIPNEYVAAGNNKYLVYWQNPAKVARYNKIPFQERLQMKLGAGVGALLSGRSYISTPWVTATTVDLVGNYNYKNITGVTGNQTITYNLGQGLYSGQDTKFIIDKETAGSINIVLPANSIIFLKSPGAESSFTGTTVTFTGTIGTKYLFEVEEVGGQFVTTVNKLISA